MKRFIVGSILAVALFAASARSADEETRFGARATLVAHAFYEDYYHYSYEPGLGYGAGVVIKRTISDILSLRGEASFYYRSLYRLNSESRNEMAVSFPIMVNYHIPHDSFDGYVSGGLQLDIPFGSTVVNGSGLTSDRSGVDAGFLIGAGYMIVPDRLGVDARYVFYFNKPLVSKNVGYMLMSYGIGVFVLF